MYLWENENKLYFKNNNFKEYFFDTVLIFKIIKQSKKMNNIYEILGSKEQYNKYSNYAFKHIQTMLYNTSLVDEVLKLKDIIYCLLLKGCIINLSSDKSSDDKAYELLQFIFEELKIFLDKEFSFVFLYLKKDKRTENFFRKIQVKDNNTKKKNSLDILKGMAWDFMHLRILGYFIAYNCNINYLDISYIITRDKGFNDFLDAMSLSSFCLYGGELISVFDFELENRLNDKCSEILKRYYSQEKGSVININYKKIYKKLENELTSIIYG